MSLPAQSNDVRRLVHFTPLRYPGGKAKLAKYVKDVITYNDLSDGKYVEPYAGGCGLALELLFHEYVSEIYINDISHAIYAFWWSVLERTEELCRLIVDTPVTVHSWNEAKHILMNPSEADDLALGFAVFFLNRTNRSGILNGGVIGGKDQSGPWKISARYNAAELAFRIQSIASLRGRIRLSSLDAAEFIRDGILEWPSRTLIYCDPPYYVKGRHLYYDYYQPQDHAEIARIMTTEVRNQKWLVSYDDVDAISTLYSEVRRVVYLVGYSARTARREPEVMFFSNSLTIPAIAGPLRRIA